MFLPCSQATLSDRGTKTDRDAEVVPCMFPSYIGVQAEQSSGEEDKDEEERPFSAGRCGTHL